MVQAVACDLMSVVPDTLDESGVMIQYIGNDEEGRFDVEIVEDPEQSFGGSCEVIVSILPFIEE